jgi:tetratricopeptide (TPR) repeat protein
MNESLKKLLQFSLVFAVGAIIIFFSINSRKPPSPAANDNPHAGMDIGQMQVFEEQLKQLKASLKDDPDNVTLITHVANIYYDLDQPADAIEYYERALKLNPDDPMALTDCAVMYFESGNGDKALEYLDKAIAIKPDLAQAWFNKGLILMAAKNEPAKALEVWKEYVKLAPETEQAKFIKEQIESIEANNQL